MKATRILPHQPDTLTPEQDANDLEVEIWTDEHARFIGTHAQLVAEGLVPETLEMPFGHSMHTWVANGLQYTLTRSKPHGAKGARRSWEACDWWALRFRPAAPGWRFRRAVERKKLELMEMLHRETPEYSEEFGRRWQAHRTAQSDRDFQRFLKGLLPSRRRPSKGEARRRQNAASPDTSTERQ